MFKTSAVSRAVAPFIHPFNCADYSLKYKPSIKPARGTLAKSFVSPVQLLCTGSVDISDKFLYSGIIKTDRFDA